MEVTVQEPTNAIANRCAHKSDADIQCEYLDTTRR